MTERKEFEAKYPMPVHAIWVGGRYAATEYDAWDVQAHQARWEGWQARAELGEGTPHCTEKLNALHANHIALQAEYDALIERHNDLHTLHCNVLDECEALRLELALCGQLKRGYQEQAALATEGREALRLKAARYDWLQEKMRGAVPLVRVLKMHRGTYIHLTSLEQLDAAMGKEKA